MKANTHLQGAAGKRMADQIHWPQVPLVGGGEALAFPLLGSTRQRKPWQPRATQAVVPLGAVATTRASPRVVPVTVRNPVAQGAIAVSTCNRDPEPHTKGNPEESSIQVKTKNFGRPGKQPGSSSGLLDQLKMGSGGFIRRRNSELRELRFVDGGRQVLLAECAGPGQAVGVKHDGVVGGGALVRTRPIRGVSGVQPSTSLLSGSHRSQVSSRGVKSTLA